MTLIDRVCTAYRRRGAAGLCKHLATRCVQSIVPRIFQAHDELVFVRNLTSRPDYRPTLGLTITPLQPTELAELEAFITRSNVSPGLALQRLRFSLQRGYGALLARYEGGIIGYGWWASTESAPHPQAQLHSLHLHKHEAFVFDLFIDPALRKRQAGLEFLIQSEQHGFARGYRTVYSIILKDNRRSSWVHHLAGWHHWEPHRRVSVFLSAIIHQGQRWQRYDRRWF